MQKRSGNAPTAAQAARHERAEALRRHREQRQQLALTRAEHRRSSREKLAGLQRQLVEAIKARKARIRATIETIREQRRELRAELKAMRQRVLAELADKLREERAAARLRYLSERAEARRAGDSEVERARAALVAERRYRVQEQQINRAARARRGDHLKIMMHPDFDTSVGAKAILGGFGPLYERVKHTLRTLPGQTRAEAFLDHAERRPEDVYAAIDPKPARDVERVKNAIASVKRSIALPQPHELAQAERALRSRPASPPSPPKGSISASRELPSNVFPIRFSGPGIVRAPRHASERVVEPSRCTEKTVKAPEVRSPAVLAKMIKADIKAAVKAGQLPKDAAFSVRTSGNSIRVRASNLPFPVTNPDAYYVQPGANHISYDSKHFRSRETTEAQFLRKKLDAIVDAYHWDKSDLSTDYHHSRFYRDVVLDEPEGAFRALQARKLAEARSADGSRNDAREMS